MWVSFWLVWYYGGGGQGRRRLRTEEKTEGPRAINQESVGERCLSVGVCGWEG